MFYYACLFDLQMKGDSFSSAHTWKKCSFVIEIIQHVEYSVPMACVAEIVQNATAHWGTCLRQQSRVTLSSADSSSVRQALGAR
jgi:hypothetical protein